MKGSVKAIHFACGKCGAGSGEGCVTGSGRPAGVWHADRLAKWFSDEQADAVPVTSSSMKGGT